MPSAVKPVGVCTFPVTATPPWSRPSQAWWQRASMWVPECSVITSSADALVRDSAASRS